MVYIPVRVATTCCNLYFVVTTSAAQQLDMHSEIANSHTDLDLWPSGPKFNHSIKFSDRAFLDRYWL